MPLIFQRVARIAMFQQLSIKNIPIKGVIISGMLLGFVALVGCAATSSSFYESSPSDRFHWESSAPLISPTADKTQKIFGVKDPSIVSFGGRYHVFITIASDKGWSLAYTSFRSWEEAKNATVFPLENSPMGPGYRAAPQVFYFAPQKLWYLVYQGGPPLYSTTNDISDPLSWSAPKPFFNTTPDILKHPDSYDTWLDFWNICDDRNCYLFFTGDNGDFYRAETTLEQFPNGFHSTVRVMTANNNDIFEASNTYKLKGTNTYLTLVEAIGEKGRYFRAWTSESLAGNWTPIPTDPMNTFADSNNVDFSGSVWAEGVSHGEMLRSSADQTLTIDPCKPLQFLYQGLESTQNKTTEYIELPYSLGLLTAISPNPVSELCESKFVD